MMIRETSPARRQGVQHQTQQHLQPVPKGFQTEMWSRSVETHAHKRMAMRSTTGRASTRRARSTIRAILDRAANFLRTFHLSHRWQL